MSDYKKLKMTADKNEGSFVETLQGQTGVGFAENTRVHKDWWARTQSYDETMESLQRGADEREDILEATKNILAVNDNGKFKLQLLDGRTFTPTDHALSQFSIRTNVPSSTVIQKLRSQEGSDSQDVDCMVDLANNSLRRVDQDKQFRLRTYTDGTCRAFVTDKYAPIDNRWFLETVKEFLPDGRVSHWRGDEDTIFGNVLLPDTIMDYGQEDDSDYGGMISIGNCEIGKRRASLMSSIFRAICMNGCIWGQVKGKEIKQRHIGTIDLDALKLQMAENIEYQLPILPDGIRKFIELQTKTTNDVRMKNVIAAISMDSKMAKKEATEVFSQWAEHERQDRNLFGVVNAITRAGQVFDNQTWVKFDALGGDLVDMKQDRWDSLLKRAESLDEKDFEKVFAVSA
jgi:hypothetical protein